jgi:phosphatidylethanolamine/phosphatidyl-N-methylethanolamine N-methyltransferase
MASCIPDQARRVVEFGAGTGALTWGLLARGLQPENLVLIESNPLFAAHLRKVVPRAQVVEGYAQDLAPTGDWDAILSGLPILSFPVELQAAILRVAKGALAPGAPLVQVTYGTRCPYQPEIMAAEGFTARRGPWVGWNIPPARVWVLTAA